VKQFEVFYFIVSNACKILGIMNLVEAMWTLYSLEQKEWQDCCLDASLLDRQQRY
jgi:hypothetical protein